MKIRFIQGNFNSKDATDLLILLIHAKIKFHESKININCRENDINMHETAIRQLQKYLFQAKNLIEKQEEEINIQSEILINN